MARSELETLGNRVLAEAGRYGRRPQTQERCAK
jgi:hypothetical protein